MKRERELLFGVFAVQMKRVAAGHLVQAAVAWAADPSRSLADHLAARGALSPEDRALVEQIVDRIVEAHAGDAAEALRSFGGEEQVYRTFHGSIILTQSDINTVPAPPALFESQPDLVPGVREAPERYSQVSEYARGGMGRILLVHDRYLGRNIALKELFPAPGSDADPTRLTPVRLSADYLARFLQEARITGQLEHPAIVPVYELGYRADGTLYYTMKLVRGRTLAQALREARTLQGRLALLNHFLDLCHAVAYAHSRGVLHRDIKPHNVMVGEFGETVVLDWGLAKIKDRTDAHEQGLKEAFRSLRMGEAASARTVYGQAMGTPNYMPPEQAYGRLEEIDERSDVYSLGAVLYELLTGRLAFLGRDGQEVLDKVIAGAPAPVASIEPDAPAELAAICQRAMARRPEDRYGSAKELAEDVQRYMSGALVLAHAYTFGDYMGRFVRKHKSLFATVTAALVALVAVTAVYIVNLRAANRQLTWENYAVTMRIAQEHLRGSEFATADRLLNATPPGSRNWEWGRLRRETTPVTWELRDSDHPDETYGNTAGTVLSPDGRYLLVRRFYSGMKQVYDIQQGRNVFIDEVGAVNSRMDCDIFLPGGTSFASLIDLRTVGIWDFGKKEQTHTLSVEAGRVRSLAASPHGRRLAGFVVRDPASAEIVLWDLATAAIVGRFGLAFTPDPDAPVPDEAEGTAGDVGPVQGCVLGFFPDGRRLVFVDDQLGVLDTETGERRYAMPCRVKADFAPDSGTAALLGPDGAIHVWDLNTFTETRVLEDDFNWIQKLALRGDGRAVAVTVPLRVIDLVDSRIIYASDYVTDTPAFIPNGKGIVGLSPLGNPYPVPCIVSLERKPDKETIPFLTEDGRPESVKIDVDIAGRQPAYSFDPAVKLLAYGDDEGFVSVWRTPDFRRLMRWRGHDGRIARLAFSPDSARLATAGADGVRVWNAADGLQLLEVAPREGENYGGVAFSPDGKWLAVGAQIPERSDLGQDLARVLDSETGELRYEVAEHPGACNYVAFSPDGRWLVTGAYGAPSVPDQPSLLMWDAETGTRRVGQVNAMNWPWQVAFVPHTDRMIVLGLTMEIAVWDFGEQREVYRIRSGAAEQVVPHPNGQRFAVARRHGLAVHATSDGRELTAYRAYGLPMAFTLDGRSLYCGDVGGSMARLESAPWENWTRQSEFVESLREVRELLALHEP